ELNNTAVDLTVMPEFARTFGAVRCRLSWPFVRRSNGNSASAIAHEEEAAGRIDDVRKSLDDPLAERRCIGPCAPEGLGEAQPFRAVVVTVLEEMLGNLELQPSARARAGDQHHCCDG